MAEAKRSKAVVRKVVEVEEHFVDLRLSIEEAQFIYNVMNRIGGNQTKSRRRHADNIYNALVAVTPGRPWADKDDIDENNNSIYFKDEE